MRSTQLAHFWHEPDHGHPHQNAHRGASADRQGCSGNLCHATDHEGGDPASDERVGNEYLRNTIPQFNEAFAGKWNWVNQPKAFDRMTTELVAAVQAGGEVPDLFELSNTQDVVAFYRNGTAQDLLPWVDPDTAARIREDVSRAHAALGPEGAEGLMTDAARWLDALWRGEPAPIEALAIARRLELRGAIGRVDAANDAQGKYNSKGLDDLRGLWIDGGSESAKRAGEGAQHTPSQHNTEGAPKQPNHDRFGEDQPHHTPAAPADRP